MNAALRRHLVLMFSVLLSASVSCGDDTEPIIAGDSGSIGGDVDTGQTGSAITPRFDPDGEDFYATPWPSDSRIGEDGVMDLSNFPEANNPFISVYLDVLTEFIHDFSTIPVVYVGFDGAPSADALPEPVDTLSPDSPLQLFSLGEGSCGTRIPIESRLELDGDAYIDANVLAVAPVPGFVLEPGTPYAFVVTRSFGEDAGLATLTPSAFEGLLDGTSADADLVSVYAPLTRCLESAGLVAEDVAVATVFTTQDPREELVAMRRVALDPDSTDAPTVSDWTYSDAASIEGSFTSYWGTFETPIFQRGTSPYNSGGGVELDAGGNPIIQRYETVPFMITFPEGDGPFPIMIWEDGTGASLDSYITSPISRLVLREGFAIASFEPQFHGDRATVGSNPEQHTFNYFNPESGRTVFRQQVIDTSYFIRLLREALDGLDGLPALDTQTLIFGGQSQGALVGAITAGVETEIHAYALNGIGGYLSTTIVERKDPIDINAQIQAVLQLNEPVDRFHPLVALTQMGADAVDTLNYAAYWRGWPEHQRGANILLINGRLDVTTPTRSINSITIAGDVAPVAEPGWDVDPFGVWDVEPETLPVSANTSSISGESLTIATILDADQGHYTIYRNEWARHLAVSFWSSAADGVPVISE